MPVAVDGPREHAMFGKLKGGAMTPKLLILCTSVLLVGGCNMHHRESREAVTKEVQAQLDRWTRAFEAKDVNTVMSLYAQGAAVTAYDLVPPLQYKGADAYRKDYADFFAQVDGPLHVELRDSHIETGGGLAVAFGLERISGKLKSGQTLDSWMRYTSAFKRIDGQWLDIHDHVSVPADLGTGKAMLDLKP